MENVSGLMSNESKMKSLKALWISKQTVNRANDGDGGNGEGQFVKRGMVVTMQVDLKRGFNASDTVR